LTIKIDVFNFLDQINIKHGIKTKDWAKASGIESPRISELRLIFKKGSNEEVGRAFGVGKCSALINGLIKILGGGVVRNELLEKLHENEDIQERLLIMVLSLSGVQNEQAEMYLSALLGMNEEQKKT